MNTCKDCIHYEVCQYHIDEETTMTVNECSHEFKHKEQYIKLPAYVGQQVWLLDSLHKWDNSQYKIVGFELKEGKVSMLQQKADKSWKIRITINHFVSDYTIDEFNNCVFTDYITATVELHNQEQEFKNGRFGKADQ